MTIVETLEKEVSTLNENDLYSFRNWFYEFDSDFWDSEIESDVHSGKFDNLAKIALKEFESGTTVLL